MFLFIIILGHHLLHWKHYSSQLCLPNEYALTLWDTPLWSKWSEKGFLYCFKPWCLPWLLSSSCVWLLPDGQPKNKCFSCFHIKKTSNSNVWPCLICATWRNSPDFTEFCFLMPQIRNMNKIISHYLTSMLPSK